MRLLVSLWLLTGLGGGTATAVLREGETPSPFRIVKTAEGVYAALQTTEQRFNDSNSVVIVNAEDVIVVDSQTVPSSVRALVGEIRKITDKPVRFVLNTHWHGDHTQGDFVYREFFPDVDFIGHASLVEDIPGRAAAQLEEDNEKRAEALHETEKRLAGEGDPLTEAERADLRERLDRARRRYEELRSVRWVPPTLVVEEELTIRRGDRSLRILHRPGHTRGDLVVHMPQEKILITGDLIDDLPYGGHGIPSQWLASLKSLRELDFDIMITGHGRIHRGKEHLILITRLVETIIQHADRAVAEGVGLEEAKKSIDLSEFREALVTDPPSGRAFDYFMPAAVERAYREAKGEALD